MSTVEKNLRLLLFKKKLYAIVDDTSLILQGCYHRSHNELSQNRLRNSLIRIIKWYADLCNKKHRIVYESCQRLFNAVKDTLQKYTTMSSELSESTLLPTDKICKVNHITADIEEA